MKDIREYYKEIKREMFNIGGSLLDLGLLDSRVLLFGYENNIEPKELAYGLINV